MTNTMSASDAVGALGQLGNVMFHLDVDGQDGSWSVRSVRLTEKVNSVPTAVIEAVTQQSLDSEDLLHAACVLSIEAPDMWHPPPVR